MPRPDWPTAAAYLPEERSLASLRSAAAGCEGCPLHAPATQTVFGRGDATARVVLVGEQPGDRRIHATPGTWEVAACRPWLRAELDAVRPELVVLLGATAAKTVFGSSFRVTQRRGVALDWPDQPGPTALATIHPSAVLRADDREAAMAGLVADLRTAATLLP